MGKTITTLKFVNPTNETIDYLTPQEVRKIKSVNDKDGKPHVMVEYYDDEFWLNCTMFCDSIEFETKEIEENEDRF